MSEILKLRLSEISLPNNSRSAVSDDEMAGLMATMKHQGQLQPIGVNRNGEKWFLVWGFRRYAAAKKLGWATIDCVAAAEGTSDKDLELSHLIENTARIDLPLYDLGRQYVQLQENHKMTIQEIAIRVGQSPGTVKDAIQTVTEVPQEYREKVTRFKPGRPSGRRYDFLKSIESDFSS